MPPQPIIRSMSEKQGFEPDILMSVANGRLQSAFGDRHQFRLIDVLDRENGPAASVYRVIYQPSGKVRGLGQWPKSASYFSFDNPFAVQPGAWNEEPHGGEELVVKMQDLYYPELYSWERDTLLLTNRLFLKQQKNRPVRLLGYGQNPEAKLFGYLCLEYIKPPFMQAGKYLEKGALPADEAIDLAIGFADIMRVVHSTQITHGDLIVIGAFDHVYWNPSDRAVRIIDWHEARFARKGRRIPSDYYGIDQTGVGQVLMKSLTGEKLHPHNYIQLLQSKVPAFIRNDIRHIIEMSTGVRSRGEGAHYPWGAKGSWKLHSDLLRLKEKQDKHR